MPVKEAITISTTQTAGNADFEFLRQEAVRIIQQLGGHAWTDHNRHDPGITILEQLCYAISDLCYRISFDVPDILANGNDSLTGLHTPYDMLTGSPVTLQDLKKMVLDVPGVRNAWIGAEPFELRYHKDSNSLAVASDGDATSVALRGLYKVFVEVLDEIPGSQVRELVRMRLQAFRMIGEDFTDVVILKEQPITIHAALEIGEVEDPEWFLAAVYQAIDEDLSVTPRFFTLHEMLQQGHLTEDVMNGPPLMHGFLTNADLDVERRSAVFASDLVKVIHSVPGTIAVKNIQIASRSQVRDWKLTVDSDSIPKLDMDFGPAGQNITLFRNGIMVPVDRKLLGERFKEIRLKNRKKILSRDKRDFVPEQRQSRNIDRYHSIQNHFPTIYALAEGSLSGGETPARKAQLGQLRAYLLFFDQILANHHAQLGHLHHLFAFGATASYAQQVPEDVPELSSVLVAPGSYPHDLSALSAEAEKNKKQQGRALNHLLARFAEDHTQFSMHVHKTDLRRNFERRCKVDLLHQYPGISGERGRASNRWQQVDWGGLEKRIQVRLGLSPDGSRPFYLIEHVMLRPTEGDRFQATFMQLAGDDDKKSPDRDQIDPFSLQITYIFPPAETLGIAPGVIERVLREETPAHIHAGIAWLDNGDHVFTEMYTLWRREMEEETNPFKLRALRNWLIDYLGIGKTYPITDLPVLPPKFVHHGSVGKVVIPYWEPDVTYQLENDEYACGKLPDDDEKAPDHNKGLILSTGPLETDTEFTIMAEKKRSRLKVPLHTKVVFKVGIDRELNINMQERLPLARYATVTLVITDSQEKVSYKLFDAGGKALSNAVTGNGGRISITSLPLADDEVIVLKASKNFDDPAAREITIREMPVTVAIDTTIETVCSPLVVYGSQATIILKNTQRSVLYKVYYKSFDESSLAYGERVAGENTWNLRYPLDGTNYRDISVQVPPGDFAETDSFRGTGGNLTIRTKNITAGQAIYITATKQGTTDATTLADKPTCLMYPNAKFTWKAPAVVLKGEVAEITVVNPQRGVTYQLVHVSYGPEDGTVAGAPVHFHKNIPLESARLELDFVVEQIEEVVLRTPPLLQDSTFRIRATSLYTGLTVMAQTTFGIKISN